MGNLLEPLQRFERAHLLVVGDLMLDRFIWGEVERLSPEAPVPVVRVISENFRLGGAANVVHNIRSLGGKVTACGIVGKDEAGRRIIATLKKIGASTAGVFADKQVQTIQKSRIIASPHHQQIVRLDREGRSHIALKSLKKLRDFIRARISGAMASLFLIMAKVRCTRSCSTHLGSAREKLFMSSIQKKKITAHINSLR